MTKMNSSTTKSEILAHIKQVFVEKFELDGDDVVLNATLDEDLDVDSIDAVDLIVALKKSTGKNLDPEAFKQVRTVSDIVDAVHDLLSR
jgi:acyl carrier protein